MCFLSIGVFCCFSQKHLASVGGLKMKERGKDNNTINQACQRKCGGKRKYIIKKRGKFNTQPGGSHGVSNCVIKYVTGSVDVSAEAWSLCHYCMKSMLLLCRRLWQHRHFCAKAQACIWLTVPAVKANFTNTFYLHTHSVKGSWGL